MKLPDTDQRIRDILDSVVAASDARAAAEIDYYNTRSPMDREKMKESQEAYQKAYDRAVNRLNAMAWTGGKFVEELGRDKP